MSELKLVVGLGNPGPEYAETRHNLGFKVVEALEEVLAIEVKKQKFGARVGDGSYKGQKVMLMKPWEYMNRSGQAVATAAGFFKLPLTDLLVIGDDFALDVGRIRLRAKGSAGGHNGLNDIIAKLGSDAFARCRVGIGHVSGAEAVNYVLGRPAGDEKPLLNDAVLKARDAALCWIEFGINKAMNLFNTGSPSADGDQ
jgi:peptidyl-tRNA hydrolase, PTH1 family